MYASQTLCVYSHNVGDITPLTGSVLFEAPKAMKAVADHTLHLKRVVIPKAIPNIYDATAMTELPASERIKTNVVRVSKDDGANWTVIEMETGEYSISAIGAAINSSVPTWWADASTPGFTFAANSVLRTAYITLDSTKLAEAGQLQLDLNYDGSRMYEIFGITTQTLLDADGRTDSDIDPRVDYQGNVVYLEIEGFGMLSNVNGKASNQVCSIPLDAQTSVNCISWPLYGESTIELPCSVSNTLSGFSFKCKTSDNKTVLARQGPVEVRFLINEI